MIKTLKRYDPDIRSSSAWDSSGEPCMEENEVGDYVRYEDAQARIAELEEQQAASQPAPSDLSTQSTDQPNVYTKSENVDTSQPAQGERQP